MLINRHRFATFAVASLIGVTGLAGCGADESESGGDSGDGASSPTIALLLPESKTTRYEAFDRPIFEAKVADLCSECEVVYFNADQDEAKQTQQVDAAISQGADVVVLDPVNGAGAGGMVTSAKNADATVIAYDRFIAEADYYMSFDNQTVGKLQAEALVDAMGGKGDILMLNGAPSDPNAGQFKEGAHSVLDSSDVTILEEFDNPDWSPRRRRASSPTSSASTTPTRSTACTRPTTARPAAWWLPSPVAASPATHCPRSRVRTPARRDPADRRRRAGDDHLQADHDRGRDRRRGGRRAGEGRRGR